ncbi:MAG: L-ectoine synthase [Gammaproteobacteria bacterium]|nr:MAG: L-ectoine synthase [Gammaproteobacteria bacterium]
MIVRTLQEARAGRRRVCAENWESVRLVLREDGMGFSFHITTIREGTRTPIWYKHHLEAVYCIDGEGEIEDLDTGLRHPIRPGTLYALDRHDRHVLHCRRTLQLACVFNPALRGDEVHDADGAYPPAEDQEANAAAAP